MNLTQLRYFCEIASEMSFSKAADRLFLSQSSLSKSIHALETELNRELFIRSGKQLKLSAGGEILLPYAREMVSHFDRTSEEALRKLGLSNQRLSVGIPPTAGAVYFHRVVREFSLRCPETDLQIEEGTSKSVIRKIKAMKQDLGIVIEPCLDEDLNKFSVVESEAVVLVPAGHPLANRDWVSFSELKDETFVLISEDYMFHDLVREKCRQAGFVPQVVFTNAHWEWLYAMVVGNEAITILPLPLVQDFLSDKVHVLHLKDPEFPWILSVVFNKKIILTDAMKIFMELCQQQI